MRVVAPSVVMLASIATAATGCTPPPQHHTIEMVPIGTYTPRTDEPSTSAAQNDEPAPTTEAPLVATDKTAECSGARFDNLYLTLTNPACVVETRGDKPVDVKPELEVSVSSRTPEIIPGGRVDLLVTYKNKSDKKSLQLHFLLDPSPRFDVEAQDSRGRPAGQPKGRPPKFQKSSQRQVARITLLPGGVAKMKVGWDASNHKWATDVAKGDIPDGGYPKVTTTPLPVGAYTLRVQTPLTLVQESADHELSAPKVSMDVKE